MATHCHRATPGAGERTREVHGEHVRWCSPDEIATLIALDERARKIARSRRVSGAEILQSAGSADCK
jgi:hypothetical protein